jgi:Tfp pilus assembly PilM family ATPase
MASIKSVGLLVSESLLRAALVEQSRDAVRLTGFWEAAVPDGGETPWPERAVPVLRQLLEEGKIPRGNVVAGLESGEILIRHLSVPFKEETQIRKTVKFELETQVTQYAAEDLVADFTVVSETESGANLLAAAVPKELLTARLRALSECGVDPAVVDLELFAVVRALRAAGALGEEAPVLIVHGAPKFAKLILIEEGLVRSLRTIRFALPGKPAAAPPPAPEEEGDPEPLVTIPEDAPEIDALAGAGREALLKLLSKEIARFLLGTGGKAPAKVHLTGEFESSALAAELQEAIHIPVELVPVLEAFEHEFDEDEQARVQRRILEPLGLALRGLPQGEEGLDFRRDEFAFTQRRRKAAGAALIGLELLLMLIGLVCLDQFFRLRHAQQAVAQVAERKREFAQQVTGEAPAPGADPYEAVRRWASERSGAEDYPLKRSALDELAVIYQAVEEFGREQLRAPPGRSVPFFLHLTHVDAKLASVPGARSIGPGSTPAAAVTVTIQGLISHPSDVEGLRNALTSKGLDVVLGPTRHQEQTMKYAFTMTVSAP